MKMPYTCVKSNWNKVDLICIYVLYFQLTQKCLHKINVNVYKYTIPSGSKQVKFKFYVFSIKLSSSHDNTI